MKYMLVAFALAACGSKSSPAPTAPKEPEKRAPLPADLVWKDMNADQRHQYMEETVMPETKKLFVAFDATAYEKMDCKTCHGPGAEDGSFEMPNPKIKPLPNTPEAFMAWVQKDERAGKYAQFMSQQLEPKMGELLHEKLFDPATKTPGFSCCHCLFVVAGTVMVLQSEDEDDHDHDHDHAK
jgi:hypothetical protein